MKCAHCSSPLYVGWTSGDEADAKVLVAQIAAERRISAVAVRCASHGWDVLARTP